MTHSVMEQSGRHDHERCRHHHGGQRLFSGSSSFVEAGWCAILGRRKALSLCTAVGGCVLGMDRPRALDSLGGCTPAIFVPAGVSSLRFYSGRNCSFLPHPFIDVLAIGYRAALFNAAGMLLAYTLVLVLYGGLKMIFSRAGASKST